MINEDFHYKLELLQQLILETKRNSSNAFNSFYNFSDEAKYYLAVNYLAMAHNSYIEILTFIEDNKYETTELTEFTKSFWEFKYQFDDVIVNKDTNTSWLDGAKKKLDNSYEVVFDFISDFMQMNINK